MGGRSLSPAVRRALPAGKLFCIHVTTRICIDSRRRSELVAVALLLTLALRGLDAHLLVVLLQGGQILPGLGELTLLHPLTDVPVHEGTLRVHEVELMVNATEHLRDGSGVRDHADSAH